MGDRPFTASHVAADAFDEAEADRVRQALDGNGLELSALAYYDNNLHPDPTEREAALTHVRACIDAAAALGGVPVGTFIGRDPAAASPTTCARRSGSSRRWSSTPASAACV